VAPIDGYIETAYARAGEAVEQGELIATLDRRDLEIDRRRLASQREDLSKRHGRAIGSMERAEAAIIEAQLGKVSAQLDLVDEQLARMRITAPFDGLIVSGDLSHRLGSPVERGQVLFELAPLDSYRMTLQVHESEIGYVEKGQRGYLTLSAKPGDRLPFVVDEIIGIAEIDGGQNGFRVEAHLETATGDLRPGMRGVGKIEIDERSRLWVWGHRLYERMSLLLWSHLP
jgi:multidrug resistance efflux pump